VSRTRGGGVHVSRGSNILISVTVLALSLIGSRGVAHAHDPAIYIRAGQDFEALFAEAAKDGRAPRLVDRNAADLIRVLSDSKRCLDETTYEMKDLVVLGDVCGQANAAVMSYGLFDHAKAIDRQADATRVALQVAQLMERNVVRFQAELQQLPPFLVRCLAKGIPLPSGRAHRRPARGRAGHEAGRVHRPTTVS